MYKLFGIVSSIFLSTAPGIDETLEEEERRAKRAAPNSVQTSTLEVIKPTTGAKCKKAKFGRSTSQPIIMEYHPNALKKIKLKRSTSPLPPLNEEHPHTQLEQTPPEAKIDGLS